MFSGIGGFELGIQNALEGNTEAQQANATIRYSADNTGNTLQKRRQSASCIGYSEIDKYAIKVYERQFNGHTNYGDATKINAKELPDFDLLVGGFPCQAFSVAGKRQGFNDTRGTLFFDIARILSEKRPRHLVLENVKGLLSHDQGKTFQTILGVLSDLGYRVEWQVLNSKDFGVPQNRERIYFVGHLRGECSRQVLPITKGTRANIRYDVRGSQRFRVYNKAGLAPTIPTMQGGNTEPKIIAQRGRGNPPVQTIEPRPDDNTNTITSVAKDNLVAEPRIRRLTPKECERLQGFPDDWTKYGVGDEPISDTQRYKMCGNAVTTNVIEAVMRGLYENCE
jgi:DNA (cytosine-5)-methyltransferase 1